MNSLFLILGGGAILYYLSQQKTTPPTPTPQQPATPGTTTAPPATSSTPPIVPPVVVPPATPPAPSLTLAQIHSALQTTMQQHPDVVDDAGHVSATFSQFNWYLNQVSQLTNLPDYFTATGGNTDPNTPISFDDYWAIMEPWLRTNRGLSGISERGREARAHAPILWRPYVGPGGWRA